MSADLTRRLSAILSMDVEGYSRLMREDEHATVRTLTAYRTAITHIIQQYRGRVVDSPGDNLLAEFGSVVDAVNCAVEIQRELAERNAELTDSRRMRFRIGINLGDVLEEGKRIYGDGVNIAARMESLAEAGGVCISGTVYDAVESKIGLEYEFRGEHEVKNIDKPIRAYRVLSFPGAAAYRVVKAKRAVGKSWRNYVISTAAVLLVVAAGAVWHFYFRAPLVEPASVEKMAYPLPDKPSIAVLPFDNMSGDPAQEYFSDGLSEEIITALSKVPQLFVIARNSSFSYKGKSVKVNKIAEELGVNYVLEGSVRREGERVRITAQLIDALTGRHLWAERYDRPLKDIFALQDAITMKILTALQVKLTGGEIPRVAARGTDNLQAYLKVLQAREPFYKMTKEGFSQARRLCDEALALDPDYAAAYLYIGSTHFMDAIMGSGSSFRESLKLAFESTTKCIAIDDSYAAAHSVLGFLYVMRGQHDKGLAECERAIVLEPNSPTSHIWMSLVLRFSGNHEESFRHAELALRLDPFISGWWFRALGWSYAYVGRYDEAIDAQKKSLQEAPDDISTHVALTLAYSWAGRLQEARTQAAEVLRIDPKYSLKTAHLAFLYKHKADQERFLDGLRQAGIPEEPPLPLPDKPSIAVLPFENMSGDPEQEYFADGITEEIITALSKISELFVIARNSSFTYKGKAVSIPSVARELGVRYVLEGSVRKAGDTVRITAQLIEGATDLHLWSGRYDRQLKDIFAVQDEITKEITTHVNIKLTGHADLMLAVATRTDNFQAYLKVLEGMSYNNQSNFSESKKAFEEALALDPNYSPACGWLAWTYLMQVWFGPGATKAQSLGKAFEYAEKCISLDESNYNCYRTLGHAYLLKRDYDKALEYGKRSIELDPNASGAAVMYGMTLRCVGRYEEAIEQYERAMRLDPLSIDLPLTQLGATYVMMRRHEEAIKACRKAIGMNPRNLHAWIALTIAYSSLDRIEEAESAAKEVLKLSPNFSVEPFAKSIPYKSEDDRIFMADALRKAGMK